MRGKLSGVIGEDETFMIFETPDSVNYTFGDNFGRGGQAIYRALQLKPTDRIRSELFGEKQWMELSLFVVRNKGPFSRIAERLFIARRFKWR